MRATKSLTRIAALGALLAGLACSKSMDTMAKPDESAVNPDSSAQTPAYREGARDTTLNGAADSARTRPDQGQPVTSKGDTLNPAVDSTKSEPSGNVGVDTAAQSTMDTTAHMGNDSTSMKSDSTQ